MAKKQTGTAELIESARSEHIALAAAAVLARTQLVPDPVNLYGAQHLSDTLDLIAHALAKVAPIYVPDGRAGPPRRLVESELEGAKFGRGARVLVFRHGGSCSGLSMMRGDLRQAVAILKAVGIPELAPRQKQPQAKSQEPDPVPGLLVSLAAIEDLLRPPLVPAQIDKANRLAVSIARNAPDGRTANLAMQLMSAVHDACAGEDRDRVRIDLPLARLRAALNEATALRSERGSS